MINSILLVDDEPGIRSVISRLITPHGYIVSEAENGVEGLKKIGKENFAVIILDHNMPVMDGLNFLTALRNDIQSDVPVLMMSGNPDKELRRKCYALGVFDFINKPESPDILLARIANGIKIAELLEYRRNMKRELKVSSAILKAVAPPAELSREKFQLQILAESYSEVGGDLCLVFGADTDTPVFCLGDIAGHGVSAALFSMFVTVAARRAYRDARTPEKILTRLNRELVKNLPIQYFVTMFCCAYDVKKGVLHYVNAGHPQPYAWLSAMPAQLDGFKNPILGVVPDHQYRGKSIPFAKGDWLLMYTDGVLDVFDGKNYESDEGIAVIASQGKNIAETYAALKAHLRQQSGITDDRTVMLLAAL